MNFNNAKFIMAAGNASQLTKSDLPEIVFSGRSNVGKSSLINKIVGRKGLARVSGTPGKTATINFFNVDKFNLVDLPGYGYAKVSMNEKLRWAELVEGYFAQDRSVCLTVQIVDMRHPATSDDIMMMDYLYDNNQPFIIVLTKKDKLNKTAQAERLADFDKQLIKYKGIKMFPFSALNGEGIGEINKELESVVEEFYKNAQ